ncbi:MAG: ABC transporter permease, partial [Burkholderiaceae bacterium]|nr:ABC transporter permease [Burkholderiaceae bacterium]
MKPVILLTDGFVLALLVAGLVYGLHVRRQPQLAANWRLTLQRPAAAVSALILGAFLVVAVADSLHWRVALPLTSAGQQAWSPETTSALDALLGPLAVTRERTYSSPLAYQGFRKESFERDGKPVRDYPRLKFGGAHLQDPARDWADDVARLAWRGAAWGAIGWSVLAALSVLVLGLRRAGSFRRAFADLMRGTTRYPVRSMLIALAVLALALGTAASLSTAYHVFGTDRVGASVLVAALKSVRTALVIGALTTLVVLPLALALGVAAGYFRGWVDEVIQYVYTLLASIPDVLLIAAAVLLLQVKIDSNPGLFETSL